MIEYKYECACVHIHICIYPSSNVCSARAIDRSTLANGPQIKHSFLRAMFASQTIWRLPYSFLLLFFSPYVFPRQRGSWPSAKLYSPVSHERRIILPSTYFYKHDLSIRNAKEEEEEAFTSEFTSECTNGLSREFPLEI